MESESPLWSFRSILLHAEDKTAALEVICKGKCFIIELSPQNFSQTPNLLERYLKLMEDVNNEEDFDISDEAEQDLQDWVMEPFVETFQQIPSPSQSRVTLQDYLTPATYRYQMYGEDGKLQPFLDYNVPSGQSSDGIVVENDQLLSKWRSIQPKDITIEQPTLDESLSRNLRKVSIDGALYHFKPVYTGNREATLREIGIYKRLDESFSQQDIRVPFLHGVVREESESLVIGLVLTWIECGAENLDCILYSEIPIPLERREKWISQVKATTSKLHEAGIIWGDAKAANVLVDTGTDDAWVIDFGGGFTEGWVEKDQAETVAGDLAGLSKIEELLRSEGIKRSFDDSDD